MAQKKPLTDEELLAQFETLDAKDKPAKAAASKSSTTKSSKPAAADDPLAELESLAKARPTSRPGTPKVAVNQQTPGSTPAGSARTSEEGKARSAVPTTAAPPRKSGESTRSYHQGLTPTSEEERQEEALKAAAAEAEKSATSAGGGGGGGWGGWFSGITASASAAVKQAEAYAKEIQKNEEAQKWTEQLRGRVGDLRGLGGDLRNRALPTFTNIINTIAPPISQHERLQIHITHDLVGYPSLDPTIHAVFSRVMSQVEGGDLLVIQRGSESSQRRPSEVGFRGGSSSGWNDGPWWRDGAVKRDMGVVTGVREGTKLARVSAEAYAKEFFEARGGIEKAAEQATKILSESNPVRSSDVFLSIQPIGYDVEDDLFQGPPEEKSEGGLQDEKEKDEVVAFAVYLYDPVHSITFKSLSQSVPRKWINWLDAENLSGDDMPGQLPQEIVEIIDAGGVDPREWVAEWVEEIISQVTGVVAQRYVARRMGVGEGGIGRGKARQEFEDAAAGEAARAGVI